MVEMESSNKPSADIKEIVRQQLEPLFMGFYPSSPQYTVFWENKERFISRLENFVSKGKDLLEARNALSTMLLKSAEKANLDMHPPRPSVRKVVALMQTITYLSWIELLATPIMDIVILLLTAGGCDLHIPPDRRHFYYRHASSLEDLDSPALSLSMKLAFLEENKQIFFSQWIDRDLRNRIAHSDYEIDELGNLIVEIRGKKTKVDPTEKLNTFFQYSDAALEYILGILKSTPPTPPK